MIYNYIIKHIFNYFGIGQKNSTLSIDNPDFKLKKQVSIELENGEVINKNLWGVCGNVGNSKIKALFSDVTIDETYPEFLLILQLDNLSVFALKLEQEIGKAFFVHENDTWVELSNLMLAKLLFGIEQLNELIINYQVIDDYQNLYKYMISFLNYEETLQHNQ